MYTIFSNQGYLELLKVSGSLPVFVVSHSSASWEADGYAICSVHFLIWKTLLLLFPTLVHSVNIDIQDIIPDSPIHNKLLVLIQYKHLKH